MLSSCLAGDDAVLKLSWPDSSSWLNNPNTQPSFVDGSWLFDRATSRYFDAGSLNLNPHLSGFSLTASILLSQIGESQRIIDFGIGANIDRPLGNNCIRLFFWGTSTTLRSQFCNSQEVIQVGAPPPLQDDINLDLGKWYTLTMVYRSNAGSFTFYLNGAYWGRNTGLTVSGPRTVTSTFIGKTPWSGEPF